MKEIHITRLAQWLQCRRRGYLSGIYEPKAGQDGASLEWSTFGTAVHKGIECLTTGNTLPPTLTEREKLTVMHYYGWLQDQDLLYARKQLATHKWEYIHTEKTFTTKFPKTDFTMAGTIDAIVVSHDCRVYIVEYKTTNSIISRKQQVWNEMQTIWYAVACREIGIHVDGIVYHLIRKKLPSDRKNADTTRYWQLMHDQPITATTQNYFEQVIIPLDRYDLSVWIDLMRAMLDEYTLEKIQYPTFGYHCQFCPFQTPCNLMQRVDTVMHAERMLELDYVRKETNNENLQTEQH